MPSIVLLWILSLMFSRSLLIQVKEFTILPMKERKPCFFDLHPEEDYLPLRLQIRSSISPRIPVIFLRVPILSPVWFAFQELIMGIRIAILEETEEMLDVAWAEARVVMTGGRVIGTVSELPTMTGTVRLMPDSTTTVLTMLGVPNATLVID